MSNVERTDIESLKEMGIRNDYEQLGGLINCLSEKWGEKLTMEFLSKYLEDLREQAIKEYEKNH